MAVPYVISMIAAACIAVGYGVDGTKLCRWFLQPADFT